MENIVLTKRSILNEKADGSIYYRIELEKGNVDKVVNIGENGTVLS